MRRRLLLCATLVATLSSQFITYPHLAHAEGLADQPVGLQTASVELPQSPFAHQQATHWCWAASVANAFRSSGHAVSQERIVREVYGDVVNMRSGPNSNVAGLLDREWVDDAGGTFRARLIGLFDPAAGRDTFDSRAVVAALRSGRPLVLGTTSHAMLLIAATYRECDGVTTIVEATVFDPWPGVGVRTLRSDEITPLNRHGSLAFIANFVVTH